MLGTLLSQLFGSLLFIAIVVIAAYLLIMMLYRKKTNIDFAQKRVELRKGVWQDYTTASALYLKIFTGRQVGYSLEVAFGPDQAVRWVYHLTGNHGEKAAADKAKVQQMIQDLPAISESLFEVTVGKKAVGHSYIQIGKEEALRYLYAPREELNLIYEQLPQD